MSQPFRTLRSFVAASLTALGGQSHGLSADEGGIAGIAPAAHSLNTLESRYTQAGLIRILQEDTISGDRVDVAVENGQARDSKAEMAQSPRGVIELAPLSTPNTTVEGLLPEDVTTDRLPPAQALPNGLTRSGMWSMKAKNWVPGGFCHQPLYYEDPMLERHGHMRFPHFQPVVSGVRFFGTVPLLPYLATLRHPLDEVHTLGAYSPGTTAPALRYRAHYDHAALRNQFIVTAGTVVAIP